MSGTNEATLRVLADIRAFETSFLEVPRIADRNTRTASQLISSNMSRGLKSAGYAAEQAASRVSGAFNKLAGSGDALKKLAGGLGLGPVAGDIDDIAGGLSKMGISAGTAAGVVGALATAFVGLAVIKQTAQFVYEFDRMAVGAALSLDELGAELEGLRTLPGFGRPIPPEVGASVFALEGQTEALNDVWTSTKETLGTDLAPALAQVGRGLVASSLAAKDAYEAYLRFRVGVLSVIGAVVPLGDAFESVATGPIGTYLDRADELIGREAALAHVEKVTTEATKGAAGAKRDAAASAREQAAAAREAEAAEKAAAEAAREIDRALRDQIDASEELRGIIAELSSDRLSASDRITAAYQAELVKVTELAAVAEDQQMLIAGTAAAYERYQRDRQALVNETLMVEMAAHDALVLAQYEASERIKERAAEDAKARLDEINEQVDGWMSAAMTLSDALSQIAADELATRTEMIDRLTEARKEAAASGTQAEVDAIDYRLKEHKKAGRAAFQAEKAAAFAGVLMNTATAVMAALTIPGPAGIAASVAAGIAGGIQAGIVLRQKSPYHTGGSVRGGGSGAPDEVDIRARAGEYVVREGAARGNESALDELNRTGKMGGGVNVALLQIDGRTVSSLVATALERSGPAKQAIEAAVKSAMARSTTGYAR